VAKEKSKSAAILTIFDAAMMTPKGVEDIVAWLRKQANQLKNKKDREQYAKRCTARYLY
jgi:hypothetical protein